MPIIQITLTGMRQQIAIAFANHCDELQKHVDAVMEEMMKPEVLKNILREQLAREVRNGLDDAIKSAVRNALWDTEWRGQLAKIVGEHLLKLADAKQKHNPPQPGEGE